MLNGLIACPMQPYAITRRLVGPAGGMVRVRGHSLEIPPRALSLPVLIVAAAPADSFISVQFLPEGLNFKKKITLTRDYSTCPVARLRLGKRIAYTTNSGKILKLQLSKDKNLLFQVSADLDHYSRYALAW